MPNEEQTAAALGSWQGIRELEGLCFGEPFMG